MRRRELLVNKASGGGGITDVLFVNKSTQAKQIFKSSEWPSADGWTPIGIVVVPSSHDRYGDGTCGVMSLGGIDYNGVIQTDGKRDSSDMTWGPYDSDDDTSVPNYGTVDGSNKSVLVHWQTNSGSTSCSFYSGSSKTQLQYPYKTLNGTEVESYAAGCLSDYDGVGNTNKLNDSVTVHSAARACKRVSTLGTSKGDWYLPSAGELAYLPSIRFEVNKTISSLQSKYSSVGSLLDTVEYYWSSTEYSSDYAWDVELNTGKVVYVGKYYGDCVRPFIRFNPSTNQIVKA